LLHLHSICTGVLTLDSADELGEVGVGLVTKHHPTRFPCAFIRPKKGAIVAKLADRIQEAFKPSLDPDEQLLSVGQVTSGPLIGQAFLAIVFLKFWWVGITQKRAIFVRLTAMSGKPDESTRVATPLSNLKLDGKNIAVIAPQDGLPSSFKLYFGVKRVTGLDKDEFKANLAGR
jgi:hypothetical protein